MHSLLWHLSGISNVEPPPPRFVISIPEILKNSRFFSFPVFIFAPLIRHYHRLQHTSPTAFVLLPASFSILAVKTSKSRTVGSLQDPIADIFSFPTSSTAHRPPQLPSPQPISSTCWFSASSTASPPSHLTSRTKYGPSRPSHAAQYPSTHRPRITIPLQAALLSSVFETSSNAPPQHGCGPTS